MLRRKVIGVVAVLMLRWSRPADRFEGRAVLDTNALCSKSPTINSSRKDPR
jgi:hypothetical protein